MNSKSTSVLLASLSLFGCSEQAANKELWAIYAFMIAGIATIFFYSFMAYVRRSPTFPRPSKIIVVGLIILAIVGALIPMSQIGNEERDLAHYLRIVSLALGLPGLAVGMALFKVLVQRGIVILFKE